MRKTAAVILAAGIFLSGLTVADAADSKPEGIIAGAGLKISLSEKFSADEDGASLLIEQTDPQPDEHSLIFSLPDIQTVKYEGVRAWFKNVSDSEVRIRLALGPEERLSFVKSGVYHTVDTDGAVSEKIFSGNDKFYASLPAGFEGFAYFPFSGFGFNSAEEIDCDELNMYIAGEFGGELYTDEIGGYTGNLPLYGFENEAGLSAGAGFDRECITGDFESGSALRLVSKSSTPELVNFLYLDMRAGAKENRSLNGLKGIRFWVKVSADEALQSEDKNLYLYTAYNIPNHSHYPDWCNTAMPYYLVSADGTVTARQRILKTSYEKYQKGIAIPDGFEGYVYLPFNTDALWDGTSGKWVSQTNGLLSLLKITAANTAGKTVYLDSLGFYTSDTMPEAELRAETFLSFCTPEVDKARAETTRKLIDALLPYSFDMSENVAAARESYESLSLAQRSLIDNYYLLVNAEELMLKLDKSDVRLDFETDAELENIIKTENISLEKDSQSFGSGEASLGISSSGDSNTINVVKLPVSTSLEGMSFLEFWVRTGEEPAELTFQADCPDRCTVKTGSLYYLTNSIGTESYTVREQKIGQYYEPYITLPANFEGYVNIPFTSLKNYSGGAVDASRIGLIYIGVIGSNKLNIDAVRGSFMLAFGCMSEKEICDSYESISLLKKEIDDLGEVELGDTEQVRSLRRRYNDMPLNLQLLVDNSAELSAAEERLRELKPSKYLLDYEDKTLFDWSGLSSDICSVTFEYEAPLEGSASMKITTLDSGEFMSAAFKKPQTNLSGFSGVELRVKTGDKPAVFFIQADIPVRALLQAGAPYYLTDLNGNITGYTASGTNLGGNYGWCPLIKIPENFDGFLSFKCESFKCYDSAAAVDASKFGNFYFVFTQATELTVDAVRLYKRVLEGINILGDERTDAEKAADFDASVLALGEITLNKQAEIAGLRKLYTAFSDECKAAVKSLGELERAENKLRTLLDPEILFDFDNETAAWSWTDGAQADRVTENAASGNSLKLVYPKASAFMFSSVRRNFENYSGIEFYVSSEATSIISVQADAPYRSYIPKEKPYFLIDKNGGITERETYLNGYISIPAGFEGTVRIPFDSFEAYDAGTAFEASEFSDLYFSFADGYGKYGKLYIDSLKAYK